MVTLSLRKMLYCNSLKKTRNEIYDMINSLNTDYINNHSEDLIYILCGLFVYHSLGFCQNDEHLFKNNISSSYEWSEYLNNLALVNIRLYKRVITFYSKKTPRVYQGKRYQLSFPDT